MAGSEMDPLWSAVSSFGMDSVHLPEGSPLRRRVSPVTAGSEAPAAVPVRAADCTAGAGVAGRLMEALRTRVASCTACRLASTRINLVFGEGDPGSGIVLVGEGPGASEDETGRPFVGKAGQLLDRILASVDLDRSACYIANVVKCRPPSNRVPSPDEIEACAWILDAQIEAMSPGVIVALGASAAGRLLGTKASIGQLRGEGRSFKGIPVLVTYHPAALLRTPALKRPVWEDMKKLRQLMEQLGLPRRTELGA